MAIKVYMLGPMANVANTGEIAMYAMYTFFNGTSTYWQIKAGVSNVQLPDVPDGTDRCSVFVIEKAGGGLPNIAFWLPHTTGFVAADGGTAVFNATIASSAPCTKVYVGASFQEPITDILSMPASFSGWVQDAFGVSYSSDDYKANYIRIVEETTNAWILMFLRTTANIDGGLFVGAFTPLLGNITGNGIVAGAFESGWCSFSDAASGGGCYEVGDPDNTWLGLRSFPESSSTAGFVSAAKTGVGGRYTLAPLLLAGVPASFTKDDFYPVGLMPCMYAGYLAPDGPGGALSSGATWSSGGSVVAMYLRYNYPYACIDDGLLPY